MFDRGVVCDRCGERVASVGGLYGLCTACDAEHRLFLEKVRAERKPSKAKPPCVDGTPAHHFKAPEGGEGPWPCVKELVDGDGRHSCRVSFDPNTQEFSAAAEAA